MAASYLNHKATYHGNFKQTLSLWLKHILYICKIIMNTGNIEHALIISHKSSEYLYVMAGIHFAAQQS